MTTIVLRIDENHLATAVFVLRSKIEDVERQRRVYPDKHVAAEQAELRSAYLVQLTDCLLVLAAALNFTRLEEL
jgi:hypothetical protein